MKLLISWILNIFFVILCIIGTMYIFIRKKHNYWKKRGIKCVPGTNIFGDFFDILFARISLRDYLRDVYAVGAGEKFIGFYVFDKPFLVLRDPDAIKNVLVKDFKNFSNRIIAPIHDDIIGNLNIFSLRNPDWKFVRTKLSPVFSSSKLRTMFDLILETAQDLESHLHTLINNDNWNVVDVKDVCEKFTTDVIGSIMFGMKLNALNNPNAEFRNEGKKHFKSSYSRYFSLLSLFFMPRLAKLFKITMFDQDVPIFFKRVIPEVMAERARSPNKRNDLLDAFVQIKEASERETAEFRHLSQDDALVATGIVFFTGGFEPSASLMYLVLYELAKKPEIQEKLRQEISEVLEQNQSRITCDVVTSMFYLDMITSEGLRKYPLLHFLDREAEQEYHFPDTNIIIEKGTPIIIPMSGIHMDSNYFEDPENFIPERFSLDNKKNILPFTYFPFGDGPRNCIGMRIGLMQAKVGLIYIISQYEILPCQETPIPLEYDCFTLFTKSKNDMKLHMKRIQ